MKHEDDEPCPGCVIALQSAMDFDIEDGAEEFDEGFGDLIDAMHDALSAINRARREPFTSKHDEIANTWEAATKLVQVSALVTRAIERGRAFAPGGVDAN